jgi:membrane protease YdiL (CAAX protease family)
MSLWTPFILVLHLLYRSLVLRKELFLPYRIAIITTVVVLVLAGVAILVALAIWLPSARHDRLDMLYIIGIGVVGEEILFRGLLWDIVDSYLVNDGFRFLHISGTVWLRALAFGVMRLRTESVLWPIFAHAGLNALFNLALTFSATAYPTFTSM